MARKYHVLTAFDKVNGQTVDLLGSYDKEDCAFEMDDYKGNPYYATQFKVYKIHTLPNDKQATYAALLARLNSK